MRVVRVQRFEVRFFAVLAAVALVGACADKGEPFSKNLPIPIPADAPAPTPALVPLDLSAPTSRPAPRPVIRGTSTTAHHARPAAS